MHIYVDQVTYLLSAILSEFLHITMHAPVQTTDLGGCGKLFFLNMWDPLINIHK